MKPYKIFLSIAFAISVSTAFAQQGRLSLNINYGINMPVGSFKSDLINNTSYLGWNANLLYGISDKFSIGLQSGSNYYSQKFPRQVYNTKDGDISAVVTNTIQTIPLQAKARYNFIPSGIIQPYIVAGVGGNLITFNQYLGEFSSGKTGFYFAASPEAGVNIPFGKNSASGFTLGANYNYMPFNYGNIKNVNNWGVFAGVKFPLK